MRCSAGRMQTKPSWSAMHALDRRSTALLARYQAVRSASLTLLPFLNAEDCCVQATSEASPLKWHLAHTSWFFETFILADDAGYPTFNPAFRFLFNSYYNGVGAQHPRLQRGLLTRPTLDEVLAYRAHVDLHMHDRIAQGLAPADMLDLGLQHEQQHQELIHTDIKILLSMNPLQPAVLPLLQTSMPAAEATQWIACHGGVVVIGNQDEGFSFDNERPPHSVYLAPFSIASGLVSNEDYLAFIEDDGYDKPSLWLAEGWDWVRREQVRMPLHWRYEQVGGWQEFTLQGVQPLHKKQPVTHVSFFEADAFARWSGARLPTESEWEQAARTQSQLLEGLFGQCWQWTASSYAPYPGFVEATGAVGEYNGKFMVNQMVLRGSSAATPPDHARVSYRNFFPTHARWQLTGIRLARN